jgi:hypothetical protein
MQGVHPGDHGARVGIARRIEPVRAPGVILPVTPVLHDVVERNPEPAVRLDHAQELALALVVITALPEPVGPARQQRRPAGDMAIAANHPAEARPANEVVVDGTAGLGVEREPIARGPRPRRPMQEGEIPAFAIPHQPNRQRLARAHPHAEIAVPGIPVLPPGIDQLAPADPELLAVAAIEREGVQSTALRLDLPRPDHLHPRQLHERAGERGRIVAVPGEVLVVDITLGALEHELPVDVVARREPSLLPLRVEEDEALRELLPGAGVAEARDRVVVPEDAVIAARDDERHRDVHVVLGERHILAPVVDQPFLVLPEPVERLARRIGELLADGVLLHPVEGDRLEGAPARDLPGDRLAVGVLEEHLSVIEPHDGDEAAGRQRHGTRRHPHGERHVRAPGPHRHETRRKIQALSRECRDAHDRRRDDLEPHLPRRAPRGRHHDPIGDPDVRAASRRVSTRRHERRRDRGQRDQRQWGESRGSLLSTFPYGHATPAEWT